MRTITITLAALALLLSTGCAAGDSATKATAATVTPESPTLPDPVIVEPEPEPEEPETPEEPEEPEEPAESTGNLVLAFTSATANVDEDVLVTYSVTAEDGPTFATTYFVAIQNPVDGLAYFEYIGDVPALAEDEAYTIQYIATAADVGWGSANPHVDRYLVATVENNEDNPFDAPGENAVTGYAEFQEVGITPLETLRTETNDAPVADG